LTIIGLSAGAFFLVLLAISTFLRWIEKFGVTFSGTFTGDGRMILILSVCLAAGVGFAFVKRACVPLSVLAAGAFGTFAFVVALSFLKYGQAGAWVGLVAAAGVAGTCVWTAIRFPVAVEIPGQQAAQPSFLRMYGPLLGSQTVALVCGVIYWLLVAIMGG
jgi:hypothetical protein